MTTANYCAPDVKTRCSCGGEAVVTYELLIEPSSRLRERIIQIHRCGYVEEQVPS